MAATALTGRRVKFTLLFWAEREIQLALLFAAPVEESSVVGLQIPANVATIAYRFAGILPWSARKMQSNGLRTAF